MLRDHPALHSAQAEKNIMHIMAFKFFQRFTGKEKKAAAPTTRLGSSTLIKGRYRLEEEIGRGGMGIVYRAHDIADDRDVAVKVINLDTANAITRQQFLREVEILSRLQHPHIVAVYETGTSDIGGDESSPFLVMELVHGSPLNELPRLTYARVLEIAQQICEALEYIHHQDYVYRDLKPGNVLIERAGFQYFVKLIDFGLARPRGMAYLPTESSLAGSFFYLAPELIAGQPADVASDLYALGATLYEMITGRAPFSNFDEQTILSQHQREPVLPPSQSREDVPPALEVIVLQLLEKDPKDRFASAGEVKHALEQVKLDHKSGAAAGNMPKILTEWTGRESELSQVKELLESNPLVTILGDDEGLALVSGAQLRDQFGDGIWWADLGSLDDPARVPETIAAILGVSRDPERSLMVSLIESLREKNLLLVLSHCDGVRGASAQLAETILSTCPDVSILATAHEPLNVAAEKCYKPAP
jgi:serine/threonine protein kinase